MSLLAHSLETKERSKDVLVEDHSVSFDSFLLPTKIFEGLSTCGFRKPSPIQVKAIPVGRCGLDVIVKSKSGTGKTLVFAIVALEGLNLQNKGPQVLILAPTREIAVQIEDVLKDVGQFFDGLRVETFIGGLPLEGDLLRCKTCHIAIGTPGRVKQLITKGHLDTKHVRLFILDEADKLMENSFQNDINEIYNILPDKKQVIMCSATYPKEMEGFLGEYMLSPTFVSAENDTPLLLGLKQFVRIVKSSPNVVQQTKVKNDELVKLLSSIPFTQCLVFSNFQTRAESVSNFLNRNNFQSTFISAAQSQVDRLAAIHDLKQFKCKILLSTDLTARGIDAANVDLVVNYDIPTDTMTYLHRMGRAGRYGSTGVCVNLAAHGQEVDLLQNILGNIGGSNLFIPKLDDTFALKDVDFLQENCLCGVVSKKTDESTGSIRTEVIENKKQSKKKRAKTEDEIHEEKVKDQIDDPMLILSQLASENYDFETTEKPANHNFNSNHICNQLLLENIPDVIKKCNSKPQETNSTWDVKKILEKLAADGTVSYLRTVKDKRPPNDDENDNILDKNKTLFSIAKTLSNCATSQDDSENLTVYLNEIKKKDSFESDQILIQEGICKVNRTNSSVKNVKEVMLKQVEISSNIPESIFSIAYKCAISENGISWKDMVLSENEVQKLKEPEESQEESSYFEESQEDEDFEDSQLDYSEDNYDPDYDFEIEKDIDINYASNNQESNDCIMHNSEEYSFMKWVPIKNSKTEKSKNKNKLSVQKSPKFKNSQIVKNTNTHSCVVSLPSTSKSTSLVVESYCDENKKYFEQCNDTLWQHGLSFESVDKFDDWFWYDWQSQVGAIRDFIRQKIYVEEMSRFQLGKK